MSSPDLRVNRQKVEMIFQGMNLLNIKRSFELLIALDRQDVEHFINVHSSIVIFLLNVLDDRRRMSLLQQISDAAILYIVEEELRMRLIREISRVDSGDLLDHLSDVLNAIDVSDSLDIPPATVLEHISREQREGNNRFIYLTLLPVSRLRSCLEKMMERNVLVLLILLCYADSATADLAFSILLEKAPAVLCNLPPSLLARKIKEDYTRFLPACILEQLPPLEQSMVQELRDFEQAARADLDSMYRSARTRSFLSAVFEVSNLLRPELRDYLFHRLRREFLLSFHQVCLLQAYQEQRAELL